MPEVRNESGSNVNPRRNSRTVPQARYWLLTIPQNDFVPYLPPGIAYIKGQMETGSETGYLHWQVLAIFDGKVRLASVKRIFGERIHAEPTKSVAAEEYVWKEETRVDGTQFCLGTRPVRRNNSEDWSLVREKAKAGLLDDVPADMYIRFYRTLKEIARDNMVHPPDLDNCAGVWIWGPPGMGKSTMARTDYPNAYLKPCNKWWDGYRGHDNVIIDDFDKNHEVLGHHLKIWADKFSFIAETKGGAITIRPKKIVVTSNYMIQDIFVHDVVLAQAIMRRFVVIHIPLRRF